MTSTVRNITFDCAPPYEPYELAQFWSQVVGRPVEDGAAPDHDEVAVAGAGDGWVVLADPAGNEFCVTG